MRHYTIITLKEKEALSARDQLAEKKFIVYSGQSSQDLSNCHVDISWR